MRAQVISIHVRICEDLLAGFVKKKKKKCKKKKYWSQAQILRHYILLVFIIIHGNSEFLLEGKHVILSLQHLIFIVQIPTKSDELVLHQQWYYLLVTTRAMPG